MASSGLDFKNAALGAAFGVPFGAIGPLIDGLKYVFHCQEQCTALRKELEMVQPMLEKVFRQCQADSSTEKWVEAFKDCVEKADEVLKKCKSDSSTIWKRAYEVRYGSDILKLKDEISGMCNMTSLAHFASQDGTKTTSPCGIIQEVPSKFLGMVIISRA
jgi:hypothetical protein